MKEYDPEHPIPDLGVIDVVGERNDGGKDLVIVIAREIPGDEYSQKRLIQKIRNYLAHNPSRESNDGERNKKTIVIRIAEGSDRAIFDLLQRCRSWISENQADLKITLLPNK